MIIKNRILQTVIITISIIIIVSTTVQAINGNIYKPEKNESKQNIVNTNQLIKDPNYISEDQMIILMNKGFSVQDIEKAQNLGTKYNLSVDEILMMKGKPEYSFTKDKQGNIVNATDVSHKWSEIEIELETRKQLKKSGISDEEINNIVSQISDMKNKGNKLEGEQKKETIEQFEKELIKRYSITNEEIQKSKENGIDQIVIVANIKELAKNSNKTFDEVLNIKKDKADWDDVKKALGGEN